MQKEIGDIYDLIKEAHRQMYRLWLENILFSWRWWVGLVLSIIPWLIWIKYRKKDSTDRLLLAGAVTIIITSFFDFVGSCYKLWYYDSKLIPIIPTYLPWDITLFPVSVMFLLQIKPNANRFLKALVFSISCAFIFEKFFKWAGFYFEVNWNSFYSFPIYFFIYLIADFFSRRDNFSRLTL